MAAKKGDKHPKMIGNKYAKGNPNSGRPAKLDENNVDDVAKAMLSFFDGKYQAFVSDLKLWRQKWGENGKSFKRNIPIVDVPFYSDFAKEVGISYRTLKECEEENNKVFSQAWHKCKEIQGRYIALATMNGLSDSKFSIFFASNLHDWRQKSQISGPNDGPIKIDGIDISIRK